MTTEFIWQITRQFTEHTIIMTKQNDKLESSRITEVWNDE